MRRHGLVSISLALALGVPSQAVASTQTLWLPKRAGMVIKGHVDAEKLGRDAAQTGDVNGDEIPDAVFGACLYSLSGEQERGAAYVAFGSRTKTTVSVGELEGKGFLIQPQFIDPMHPSCKVAPAGDVNGDGLEDILFSAYAAAPYGRRHAGTVYVIFGKQDSEMIDLETFDNDTQGDAGFRINGASAGTFTGFAIDSLGDVNGDGLDDILVGAPYGSAAYVVFGRAETLAVDLATFAVGIPMGGYRISHPLVEGIPAYDVAGAGDVNGDGIPDVLIGLKSNYSGRGRAWVVFGHREAISDDVTSLTFKGFKIRSSDPINDVGVALDGAGDVNDDGFDDVLVGVPNLFPANKRVNSRGAVYVVFGAESMDEANVMDLGERGFEITGPRKGHLGSWLAGVGNINGDRFADVAVRSISSTGDPVINVVLGGRSTKTINVADLADRGFRLAAQAGLGMIDGGRDVNGDGLDDLVVGSSIAGPDYKGRGYVVWTKPRRLVE